MIAVHSITKQFGNKILYQNASFQINPGEKVGLVGPNGAGKSTLFSILTGEEGVDTGAVAKPEKLKVAYFSQNIEDMRGRTILDEVKSAIPGMDGIKSRISAIEAQLADPELDNDRMTALLEEYGDLQVRFEQDGGYDLESRAAAILTGLGFPPEDFSRMTESYSGGWKMRLALAKVLLVAPDLLLMDEPTNHLDLESIIWLENWIAQFTGSLLMTSHDRDFMNRLVSKIVEVAHGRVTVYGGNYDFYDKERKLRKEQLIASAKRQEDMLAKEREFISRFAARASHAAQVQSRVKKIEKMDLIEVPEEEEAVQFVWPEPPRGGDEVLKIEGLTKLWQKENGKELLVFQNANALVKRGDRIALVGVNGAGKSTLLKIVTGATEPTSGRVQVGAGISWGYFSQNSMDVLNPENTILQELEQTLPNASIGYLRTLLGALLFSGDAVEKKIKVLSGGEKSRVVLATILARPLNFLILDEPTNHLDILTRDILLEALKQFPGTILIVSHDRHFLKELTNRVFELSRHELLTSRETYTEYLERKVRTAATGEVIS